MNSILRGLQRLKRTKLQGQISAQLSYACSQSLLSPHPHLFLTAQIFSFILTVIFSSQTKIPTLITSACSQQVGSIQEFPCTFVGVFIKKKHGKEMKSCAKYRSSWWVEYKALEWKILIATGKKLPWRKKKFFTLRQNQNIPLLYFCICPLFPATDSEFILSFLTI